MDERPNLLLSNTEIRDLLVRTNKNEQVIEGLSFAGLFVVKLNGRGIVLGLTFSR